MKEIIDIVTNISKPLGISGLALLAVLIIFKQIIKGSVNGDNAKILSSIITKLFILAIISLILSFAGFALQQLPKPLPDRKLVGTVVNLNNDALRGIRVTSNDIRYDDSTDRFGQFIIPYFINNDKGQVLITFKGLKVRDTSYVVSIDSFPHTFILSPAPPGPPPPPPTLPPTNTFYITPHAGLDGAISAIRNIFITKGYIENVRATHKLTITFTDDDTPPNANNEYTYFGHVIISVNGKNYTVPDDIEINHPVKQHLLQGAKLDQANEVISKHSNDIFSKLKWPI